MVFARLNTISFDGCKLSRIFIILTICEVPKISKLGTRMK